MSLFDIFKPYNLWLRRRIWAGVSLAFVAGQGAMWLLITWLG